LDDEEAGMDAEEVVTFSDFVRFVRMLSASQGAACEDSLEQYLRSLLHVVTQQPNDTPTCRLFAQVLRDAFTAPAEPFNPAWLAVTDPPDFLFQFDSERVPPEDPNAALVAMLHYQIADLRRLQETGGLNDPYRYGGLQSPTKHSWYNFDPQTFLECAVASAKVDESLDEPITECSWEDLIVTLWLGQIYE
jgi:hypothetical protein